MGLSRDVAAPPENVNSSAGLWAERMGAARVPEAGSATVAGGSVASDSALPI
ncbi:MAG: hypothetical protein ACPG1Z_08310 [Planctomycetota bacterium]